MLWIPDRAVRLRALAGLIVLWLGKSHSSPPGVEVGAGEFNAGDNPGMEEHPIHATETGKKC